MVLGVPSMSPLSRYLSRGDVILSVDGVPIRKGYCVPNPLLEESKQMLEGKKQSLCSDSLTSFTSVPCAHTNVSGEDHLRSIEKMYCLNAKDVVKLSKCGDGWPPAVTNGSNCFCSQDESCLNPIQIPGLIWVEVSYSRPYSLECLRVKRKSFAAQEILIPWNLTVGGTFVFVGNIISMARSVQLTAYQPR